MDFIDHLYYPLYFHEIHNYFACFSLTFYFVLIGACVSAGMSVAGGIVIPCLLIGACVGRIVGLAVVDIAVQAGYAP